MEADGSTGTRQPILSPISLEHKEFSTNGTENETGDIIKEPLIMPAFGIKNSNSAIEDVINGFDFLHHEQRPKNSRINFSETLIITFDKDEEVGKLIKKDGKAGNCLRHYRSDSLKKILKPGPIFIRSPNEFEHSGEPEDDIDKSDSGEDEKNIITLLQRIFTLHGIPVYELRDNLLENLQRLSTGVVESFKQREQCYKYVGRQQRIEDFNRLECENKNLKCEVADLNKKITNERIKWDVVDEAFAENDSLKAKAKQLTRELELAPKWKDVDGLLEENKELKGKTESLNFENDNLRKQYASLISLKEKMEVELKKANQQVNELGADQNELNVKLRSCIENMMDTADKLQKSERRAQEFSNIVEECKTKNENDSLVKADLTSQLDDMKEAISVLATENLNIAKKVKLMKKKVYNRFFDENINLISKNKELQEKLKLLAIKLEASEELFLKNNELVVNKERLDIANKDLSQRLHSEMEKKKQLEIDLAMLQKKLGSAEYWYETLSEEKHNMDVQVCQLEKLCQEMNSKCISLNHELESVRKDSLTSSEKIVQLQLRIEYDTQLVHDSKDYLQRSNILQNENVALLERCSRLEFANSELQGENLELGSYKEDYSSFARKYERLENIALCLKQEKKFSDDQIKTLEKKLKCARRTIESMVNAKFQYEKVPHKLQLQLSQLRSCNKGKQLRKSFYKIDEMTPMMHSTRSSVEPFSASDEITLAEHNSARNADFFPVKWWRFRNQNNRVNRFFPQSVT